MWRGIPRDNPARYYKTVVAIIPSVLNLTSLLKDGEQTDARAVRRSLGVCHVCQSVEIYVPSKITYAQHHDIGATPAWRGMEWYGIAARSSLACLESILYANLTGRRPGLSDGESFHLLRPPAPLNPNRNDYGTARLPVAYSRLFLPALIRGVVSSLYNSRSPFPSP